MKGNKCTLSQDYIPWKCCYAVFYVTRKYPLRGYFLGVLTHTTAWDRLWGGEKTQVLVWNSLGVASLGSSLICLLKLWPCGFKIEYTHLGFAPAAAVPLGSEDDPGCIFFMLDTHQATFISEILWFDFRKWFFFGHTNERTDRHTHTRMDRQTWKSK